MAKKIVYVKEDFRNIKPKDKRVLSEEEFVKGQRPIVLTENARSKAEEKMEELSAKLVKSTKPQLSGHAHHEMELADATKKHTLQKPIKLTEAERVEIEKRMKELGAKIVKNAEPQISGHTGHKQLNLQDLKRQEAERNFGVAQDVSEAKERVLSRLKENHPYMDEQKIKNEARVKHLKRNMKMSRLIDKDITD